MPCWNGPVRYGNLYGPTETTIWSTAGRVHRGMGAVSIGRPISNTRVYILDAAGEPVPIGIPGEIYIGGRAWRSDIIGDRS